MVAQKGLKHAQALVALLRVLSTGRGPGRREYPRVLTLISVRCTTREKFDAMLMDLSGGGFSIRCPDPVEVGATVTVELGVAEHPRLMSIEGTVVHIEPLPDGKHSAGLRFTPPSTDQREKVKQLLDLLMGLAQDD